MIYYWASNYIELLARFDKMEIRPTPGSRGDQFLTELKSLWDCRRWHYAYKDGFGLAELANKNEILTGLEKLTLKYR